MADVVALLDRDVYGMGQGDRLLGLSRGIAVRWIDGYERRGRHYEPLVRVTATGSDTVTWGEFVDRGSDPATLWELRTWHLFSTRRHGTGSLPNSTLETAGYDRTRKAWTLECQTNGKQ